MGTEKSTTVKLGVDDEAVGLRQQQSHEGSGVTNGGPVPRFPGVLKLVEFDDHLRAAKATYERQHEVRMQHCAGPPLEDQRVGTSVAKEPHRPKDARDPIPVHA